MYAARNFNGDLHLFDYVPYLHIGAHNRVECGREEIGHDVFIEVYTDGDKILDPFFSREKTIDYNDEYYSPGDKIHNDLLKEVTFENSPYDLRKNEPVSEETKKLYVINH